MERGREKETVCVLERKRGHKEKENFSVEITDKLAQICCMRNDFKLQLNKWAIMYLLTGKLSHTQLHTMRLL